jgi:hypothetical protein
MFSSSGVCSAALNAAAAQEAQVARDAGTQRENSRAGREQNSLMDDPVRALRLV